MSFLFSTINRNNTMQYTNTQLKQALTKMLPDKVKPHTDMYGECFLVWKTTDPSVQTEFVLDTELLHLCWLVEETLTTWAERNNYYYGELWRVCDESIEKISHATWQQRTIALCNVKGIEIC